MHSGSNLEDDPGESEACAPSKSLKLPYSARGSVTTRGSTRSSVLSSESRSDITKNTKRGRPRLCDLNNLIREGSASSSAIKCGICQRVFRKWKFLKTHLSSHSGKKFVCDYPQCDKAFTQSGHLNTHHRLHTGEKPFVCTAEGCNTCCKHSNGYCPKHPGIKLKRSDFPVKPFEIKNPENKSKDELVWLQKFYETKVQRQSRQKKQKRKLNRICVDSSSQISEVCSKNSTEDITSKNHTEEISSKNHTEEISSRNHTEISSRNHTEEISSRNHTEEISSRNHTEEISSRNSTEEISSRNSTEEISSRNSTEEISTRNSTDISSKNSTSLPSGINTEVQSESNTSFPSGSNTEVQPENRTVMSISQMTPLEKEALITLASFSTATLNGWYCSNNVEPFSYWVNEYVDIHRHS